MSSDMPRAYPGRGRSARAGGRPQYAGRMLIERSMSSGFLTNTYLAASTTGGPGFLVDAGGPMQPLFDFAVRESIDVTHLLLTHHHHDHVCDIEAVKARYPKIVVLAHPDEEIDGARRFAPLRIADR